MWDKEQGNELGWQNNFEGPVEAGIHEFFIPFIFMIRHSVLLHAFCLLSSRPYGSRHRGEMNRQLNKSRPEVMPGMCDELLVRMEVKGFGKSVLKMILILVIERRENK